MRLAPAARGGSVPTGNLHLRPLEPHDLPAFHPVSRTTQGERRQAP